MILKGKWLLGILFTVILISTTFSISGASNGEYLVFSQLAGKEKCLYVAKSDGSDLQKVCNGKDITVFFLGTCLFYFRQHELYDYDFTTKSSNDLAHFDDNWIFLQTFTEDPSSPDQVLVVTQNEDLKSEQWYILDLSDKSLRKVSRPLATVSPTGLIRSSSPDGLYFAQIRSHLNYRFELELGNSARGKVKAKTIWTAPPKMTVIPDTPVWAPNSEMIAFYGKELQDSPAGFYTLFLYDLKKRELITVLEQVFAKGPYTRLEMGEFTPNWSGDSKYLIVEYQPYGLPTESSIMKYDIQTGQKTYLAESHGTKGYPLFSPSGQAILFLAKQKGAGAQVFTSDAQGKNLIQISPSEGVTEWAGWYKPKAEE